VKGSLIQLQQEDDQDEEGIKHDEEEDGLVAEFDQIRGNTSLFLFVLIDRMQVLVEQVLPELNLRAREIINFSAFQVLVFDPVRVDQFVAFSFWF